MGGSQSKGTWIDSPVVETCYGKIQGRRLVDQDLERPVDAFQGIPFAQPPVGPLRFKKPMPPKSWEGVREAKRWGPMSIQREFIITSKERGKPSEDCLYLNVFAPTWKASEDFPNGFPVMVFIHGGAFSIDGAVSYGDVGICKRLVTKDIIVVTIQYRLGYLGFWHTGDGIIPSNLGLWDQTMALRWVQDNIGAFGGDMNNVTVAGQSAGGASADMLTLSPHSNGLFHKSIPMAGNACADWAFNTESMADACDKKARKMGLVWDSPEELADKLMDVQARHFEFNWYSLSKELDSDLDCAPVVDGDFFPESIEVLRRKAPPKPLMTGVTKLEALLFTVFRKPTDKAIAKALTKCVPDGHKDREQVREDVHRSYVPIEYRGSRTKSLRGQIELVSDIFLNAPTLQLCRDTLVANEGKAPVFLYVWEHCNTKSWGFMRRFMKHTDASHGTELSYLFGKALMFPFKFTAEDERMVETFTAAFANFVKFGDPNGAPSRPSQLPIPWPRLTNDGERHFVFDIDFSVRDAYFGGMPREILGHQRDAKL